MNAFGHLSGSCAVCLQGTDTGLAFVGSPDWKAAGLAALGIPVPEAIIVVENGSMDDGPLFVRVCSDCAYKCPARFPAPKLILPGAELPAIRETLGAR